MLFSVERRAIATTTCYDVYREGECIAKIEREMFAVTPKYKFFYEGDMVSQWCGWCGWCGLE